VIAAAGPWDVAIACVAAAVAVGATGLIVAANESDPDAEGERLQFLAALCFAIAIAFIASYIYGSLTVVTAGLGLWAGVTLWLILDTGRDAKRRRAERPAGAMAEGRGPRHEAR
jgi:hypothetical protein